MTPSKTIFPVTSGPLRVFRINGISRKGHIEEATLLRGMLCCTMLPGCSYGVPYLA